jgi:hypothetical protein
MAAAAADFEGSVSESVLQPPQSRPPETQSAPINSRVPSVIPFFLAKQLFGHSIRFIFIGFLFGGFHLILQRNLTFPILFPAHN